MKILSCFLIFPLNLHLLERQSWQDLAQKEEQNVESQSARYPVDEQVGHDQEMRRAQDRVAELACRQSHRRRRQQAQQNVRRFIYYSSTIISIFQLPHAQKYRQSTHRHESDAKGRAPQILQGLIFRFFSWHNFFT